MAMSLIWTAMVVLSLLCAAATGRLDALAASALDGAAAAVELCLATAGALCLWSGVLEVMRRAGEVEGLSARSANAMKAFTDVVLELMKKKRELPLDELYEAFWRGRAIAPR